MCHYYGSCEIKTANHLIRELKTKKNNHTMLEGHQYYVLREL